MGDKKKDRVTSYEHESIERALLSSSPKIVMTAKFFCFALVAAFYAPMSFARALPDIVPATLSTPRPSPEVKSDGLIQRGREVLRSFGNRNQPVQKVDSKKTPSLFITATGIDYERRHVRLGDSMKRWKEVLKGHSACGASQRRRSLVDAHAH